MSLALKKAINPKKDSSKIGTKGKEELVKKLGIYPNFMNDSRKRQKGMEEKALQIAEKCLRRGMSVEETADLTELPQTLVTGIAQKLFQFHPNYC